MKYNIWSIEQKEKQTSMISFELFEAIESVY